MIHFIQKSQIVFLLTIFLEIGNDEKDQMM